MTSTDSESARNPYQEPEFTVFNGSIATYRQLVDAFIGPQNKSIITHHHHDLQPRYDSLVLVGDSYSDNTGKKQHLRVDTNKKRQVVAGAMNRLMRNRRPKHKYIHYPLTTKNRQQRQKIRVRRRLPVQRRRQGKRRRQIR